MAAARASASTTPNRRSLLRLGAALAAAPLLAAVGAPVRAAGEFRIGYQKGYAALIVLKSDGTIERLLEPYGLTVTWNEFAAGAPLLEGMNAGSLDFGSAGAAPPVVGQAAGTDLVYVLANPPSPQWHAILVPADSPIQSVADLKGKKVAFSKGSISQALVLKSLEAAGVGWEEIEPVYLPPPDAKPAFQGGSVDAWAVWDPYYAAEEVDSGARAIADEDDAGLRFGNFYFVRRGFALEYPEALDEVLVALIESDAWVGEHPKEAAALVAEQTGVPAATLEIAEARKNYGLGPITREVIADQQAVADLYFENEIIPRAIDINDATLPRYGTLPAAAVAATPAASE